MRPNARKNAVSLAARTIVPMKAPQSSRETQEYHRKRGLALLALAAFFILCSPPSIAQDKGARDWGGILYAGIGSGDRGDEFESDATPWSVGYISKPRTTGFILGLDIAGEGTLLDSTSNRSNKVDQGLSFNLLLGRNLTRSQNWKYDLGVIVGARESSKECDDSYLGFRCYADEDPDTDYEFNYGAFFVASYRRLALGVRATGESTQVMLGIAF